MGRVVERSTITQFGSRRLGIVCYFILWLEFYRSLKSGHMLCHSQIRPIYHRAGVGAASYFWIIRDGGFAGKNVAKKGCYTRLSSGIIFCYPRSLRPCARQNPDSFPQNVSWRNPWYSNGSWALGMPEVKILSWHTSDYT
jgi:hypothetical protein